MASDLDFVVLHSVTVEATPTGSVRIRRALLPRLVRGGIGGFLVFVAAIVLLTPLLAVVLGVLGAALAYVWVGRPSAVFDCQNGLLVKGNARVPFEELGPVLWIERRDIESRGSWMSELLAGPRLVIRYEVYVRVQGEVVGLATFRTKAAASDLADHANALVQRDHPGATLPN